MRARILTTLAAGAAAVVALGLAAPTPASASPELAAVSPYLSKQLTSLTGKTTVLVHGATLADATRAVSAAGMTKMVTFRKIGVVGARGTKAQIQKLRSQSGVHVRRGRRPADPLLRGDLEQGDPRPRGHPDPHRRRRQPADRQGRLRRGHRLRRRPDPPVLQGGRRQQCRRRQLQDAVRPDRDPLLGAEGAEQRRHRHPLARWPRHPRERHRRRPPHGRRWRDAAGRRSRRQAGLPLDRSRPRHHRRRRGAELGAREPQRPVWRRRLRRAPARRSRSPTTPTARRAAARSTRTPRPRRSSARWPPRAS